MKKGRVPWERIEVLLASRSTVLYAAHPDPPHRLTFVASGIERQLGYTPDECLAEPGFWSARVHPEDRPRVVQRFDRLLDEDRKVAEYRVRHKDGTYRWVCDEWRVVRRGAAPLEIVGLVTDVTARRAAEDVVRRNQERYHALFDDDLAGIFVSSVDGRLVACNAAYARIFGFASIQAAQASHVEERYETSFERQALLRLVRDRRRLESYRARLRRADGTAVHVVANIVGLFDGSGELTGIKGYVFDDSERAGTEVALRSTERRDLDLFENANDVIFTTDLDLRFTSVNAAVETLTGYSCDEVLRLNVRDLVPADAIERIHQVRADLLSGDGPSVIEVEVIAKNGRRKPLEVGTRLMTHEGRPTGFQAIARDISERRMLEAQVRQAQKMEAIGRLAGGVAHDFNNLLTVITGYADLLANSFAPDSAEAHDLAQVREAGRRAADLTRQLLAFGRCQMLSPKVVDLNAIVRAMHKMLRRLIGEDIELRVALEPGLRYVKVDPGQIEQVLMNLVVNARDAMPRGGVLTIESANAVLDESYVEAHPGTRAGAFAMIAVSDTGTGMDPATQARIFEPFFTTKEEGKGTGLGLSTVYGIVKQSSGNIWVYSEQGVGSVFKVYLPQGDVEVDTTDISPERSRVTSGKETILVVEDDEHVRQYAARILSASGYRVIAASSPVEAQRLARSHSGTIDLLLTDVVMPGSDGRTLADTLCSDNARLKVLFMSGYTSEAIVDHGVLDSSVNFIGKPFSAADLRKKVQDAVEN